jgi:hypothetical protein
MTQKFYFALLGLLLCTPISISAQVTLEMTYPTTDLHRVNWTIGGEKYWFASDSLEEIKVYSASHQLEKTIRYPSVSNSVVRLLQGDYGVSQTVINPDNLLEIVWLVKDTISKTDKLQIRNELNSLLFKVDTAFESVRFSEIGSLATKMLVVTNRPEYATKVYSLPSMNLENTYLGVSYLWRQVFGHAGEKYYFKNNGKKLLEIYNPNHTVWKKIPIPVPTNGGSLHTENDGFYADDNTFNDDLLVEFVFTYIISRGYCIVKIVNEEGNVILTVNSASTFRLDLRKGFPYKLYHDYNASINTVNTQYRVHSLPSMDIEQTYETPVYRIFLKNSGEKYVSNYFYSGTVSLFNSNHTSWKNIKLIPNPSFSIAYGDASQPLITDNIYEPSSSLHTFWIQWKTLSPTMSAYMLRITNENGVNIATLPDVRYFSISDIKNLPKKLITKMWDRTEYTETKVWRFDALTAIETPPSVKTRIYPNPAQDEMIIELLEDAKGKKYDIEIFNILGQQVFSKNNIKEAQHILRKEQIGQGIFLLKINQGQKSVTKKIIFE